MTAPTTAVRVRRARPEDGPRMIALDRELARFEKLAPPDDREAARLLAWIFERRTLEALVAEREGRVEGLAIFWEGLGSSFRARPFLYLEDLVVARSARGHGIGEALVRALAREGVARKAMRIDWAVLDWNEDAMRFYRRTGARHQTEWLRFTLAEGPMKKLARSAARLSGEPAPARTATIRQTVRLPAAPPAVYAALTESRRHAAFTGAAARLPRQPGRPMSAHGGYITGKVLGLWPGKGFVQTWRTTEWPEECEDSRLEIRLEPERRGTRLTMIHSDVPASQAARYRRGWNEYYWKPLRRYLRATS